MPDVATPVKEQALAGSGGRTVLLEGVFVAFVGVMLALGANSLSSDGLRLTRNYFPATAPAAQPPMAAGTGTNQSVRRLTSAATPAATNFGSASNPLEARLNGEGLHLA